MKFFLSIFLLAEDPSAPSILRPPHPSTAWAGHRSFRAVNNSVLRLAVRDHFSTVRVALETPFMVTS